MDVSRRLHLARRQAGPVARQPHARAHRRAALRLRGLRGRSASTTAASSCLAAHSARLVNSARLLDYEIPWTASRSRRADARSVVKANGLQVGYVRPVAWRGLGGAGRVGIGTSAHISPSRRGPRKAAVGGGREFGINVNHGQKTAARADFALGHAKVAGLYIICGIEKDRALKAGFDDALMLDWKGDLRRIATGANIFLVIDGTLVTPTPQNFLDGITRRAVMGTAKKRGWTVEERRVRRRSRPRPTRYSCAARRPRSCRWARSTGITTRRARRPHPDGGLRRNWCARPTVRVSANRPSRPGSRVDRSLKGGLAERLDRRGWRQFA